MAEVEGEKENIFQVLEAADRAGAIVTEQVRSIMEAAEANAEEVHASALEDAAAVRRHASDAARRVLERIDAIEGQLGELVANLRREAESVIADFESGGAN